MIKKWKKKYYERNKKVSRKTIVLKMTKSLLYLILSNFRAMCGILQLSMALYGHLWPFVVFMAFYDLIWSFIVIYGLLWPFICALWPFMAKYRSDWTCIDLSRGHRSKFMWSCCGKILKCQSTFSARFGC